MPSRCGHPGEVANAILSSDHFDVGGVVNFTCVAGHVLEGEKQLVCQRDFSWNKPLPRCQQISCGTPPTASNMFSSATNSLFGAVISFYCQSGYLLSNISALSSCQPDGSWSQHDAVCEPVHCNSSELDVTNSNPVTSPLPTVLGSVVSFVCAEGFNLVGSYSSRLCTANGTWTGVNPQCVPAPCMGNCRTWCNEESLHTSRGNFTFVATEAGRTAVVECPVQRSTKFHFASRACVMSSGGPVLATWSDAETSDCEYTSVTAQAVSNVLEANHTDSVPLIQALTSAVPNISSKQASDPTDVVLVWQLLQRSVAIQERQPSPALLSQVVAMMSYIVSSTDVVFEAASKVLPIEKNFRLLAETALNSLQLSPGASYSETGKDFALYAYCPTSLDNKVGVSITTGRTMGINRMQVVDTSDFQVGTVFPTSVFTHPQDSRGAINCSLNTVKMSVFRDQRFFPTDVSVTGSSDVYTASVGTKKGRRLENQTLVLGFTQPVAGEMVSFAVPFRASLCILCFFLKKRSNLTMTCAVSCCIWNATKLYVVGTLPMVR